MDQYMIDPPMVLESMSESILITDTKMDDPGPYIIYVNAAFEKMTGWSREEIIGKSPRILQGPKTNFRIFSDLEEKLIKGKIWTGRTINYRKNGTEFHMEWSITPIRNGEGEIYQYLAVQKEVTQIVLTELQLQQAIEIDKNRLLEIQKSNEELSDLLSEQNKMLSLFMKYVPESVIHKALSEENYDIKIGEKLDAGLLFCDIRGFTSIADRLNPNEVVGLLNRYYSKMSEVIDKYDGVIAEFVGDEIFVAFGAPLPINHPELSAVQCALAMIDELKELNMVLEVEFKTKIVVGIGINYGSVIAGNLGSENKLKYSITGSPVITAKRIEQLTNNLPNSILISQSVYDKVYDRVETKPWGKVNLKGKDEKINVFQVHGLVH
ncbi:MAG: PAS domain-containing protein [Saprospiraceae bacterium]|nr:PAS domain-containing protein [Saprospiraceae bacterium]